MLDIKKGNYSLSIDFKIWVKLLFPNDGASQETHFRQLISRPEKMTNMN